MEGPLSGVRVLDLAQMVAGSSGTQLLGDMGAEVIKIEPPVGEVIRRGLPGSGYKGDHFLYLAFNRNKKSVCLDLYTPTGREAFHDLVKVSDIVYDNFRPGVMKNLEADYETLSKINPSIICFSASGYGSSGPCRDLPGYDMIAQAETGLISITGYAEHDPVKCGPAIVDICTGIFGALAVLGALMTRARTHKGQRVETSLMNVGVYLMTYHLVHYFCSGEVTPRLGNAHLAVVPHGIYKASDDEYVALGPCWPRIARVVGEEQLIEDPRFKESQVRAEHREELDDILHSAFLKMNSQEWLEILRLADIAAGPVNTVDKVVKHPQVQHQKMIIPLAHPRGGEIRVVDNPLRFSGAPSSERYSAPPILGQHTGEVLTQLLGYSEDKIEKLRREQTQHASEMEKHVIKKQ